MSFLRRAWQAWRRPRHFVGNDLEGNKFFEFPSTSDDPRRTRRRVEYKAYEDMWNYVAGSKRLPVQWVSWLSHTRPDAPTLEELRADLERQRRILHNAALIEARDREEQTRVVAAPQSDPLSDISTTLHPPTIHEKELKLLEAEAEEQKRSDLQLKTKDTDLSGAAVRESNLPLRTRDTDWQPEAWAPQASRQRGG